VKWKRYRHGSDCQRQKGEGDSRTSRKGSTNSAVHPIYLAPAVFSTNQQPRSAAIRQTREITTQPSDRWRQGHGLH